MQAPRPPAPDFQFLLVARPTWPHARVRVWDLLRQSRPSLAHGVDPSGWDHHALADLQMHRDGAGWGKIVRGGSGTAPGRGHSRSGEETSGIITGAGRSLDGSELHQGHSRGEAGTVKGVAEGSVVTATGEDTRPPHRAARAREVIREPVCYHAATRTSHTTSI